MPDTILDLLTMLLEKVKHIISNGGLMVMNPMVQSEKNNPTKQHPSMLNLRGATQS